MNNANKNLRRMSSYIIRYSLFMLSAASCFEMLKRTEKHDIWMLLKT